MVCDLLLPFFIDRRRSRGEKQFSPDFLLVSRDKKEGERAPWDVTAAPTRLWQPASSLLASSHEERISYTSRHTGWFSVFLFIHLVINYFLKNITSSDCIVILIKRCSWEETKDAMHCAKVKPQKLWFPSFIGFYRFHNRHAAYFCLHKHTWVLRKSSQSSRRKREKALCAWASRDFFFLLWATITLWGTNESRLLHLQHLVVTGLARPFVANMEHIWQS